MHSADQTLHCIGCGMSFTRGGTYIDHIESDSCNVIRKEGFDKIRDVNDKFYKPKPKKPLPATVTDDIDENDRAPPTAASLLRDDITFLDYPIDVADFEEFKKK